MYDRRLRVFIIAQSCSLNNAVFEDRFGRDLLAQKIATASNFCKHFGAFYMNVCPRSGHFISNIAKHVNLSAAKRDLSRATAVLALVSSACAEPISGPLFTNSLGMEFVRIEPTTFTLGVDSDAKSTLPGSVSYDEQPAHEVTLSHSFYILKHPVSQAIYRASGLNGSAASISWNDAAAFCAWLSTKEGHSYRLPTEAEWVCAFQKHSRPGLMGSPDTATADIRKQLIPATELRFGPREWVHDWHSEFGPDPITDPTGPANGILKLIRIGTDSSHRLSLPPHASALPWALPATTFRVLLEIDSPTKPSTTSPPFAQAAIRQSTEPARLGPDPKKPYFTVRFALPIPPENDTALNGPLTGLDSAVLAHQHSPGFEILPNGDVLAIYFSARNSRGESESDPSTRFVQARLRYGSDEWDPPELFCDFKDFNDQSGLLWAEGNTIRFFGGGRGASDRLPFKMVVSTNNGLTWSASLPLLDVPAQDFTPQPISSAFRGADGAIYFAMDAAKDGSFLWRSLDGGIHRHDMGGRTGARHSAILPLDNLGKLLSIGGKNTSIDGWTPENISTDWGATWSSSQKAPFPALGGNQRPSLIRLANGHLCLVSDSYGRKGATALDGWRYSEGCIVAISTDKAASWHIKRLPVELPHETDRKRGTLGYATVRQAPNGVIHLLATMTHPCLHYEFNEAWIISDGNDISPEATGGSLKTFAEKYPSGEVRVTWSARICPNGRYLLNGPETSFYENGQKEHDVTYENGRKTGVETFWTADGTKLWSWTHHPENNTSTWVHYWANGRKRIQSNWLTQPKARDLDRTFSGLVADGPTYHWNRDGTPAHAYEFKNGALVGPLPLSAAKL